MATPSRASSMPGQIMSYLSYPFTSCLPSTSSSRQGGATHERQGLLSESNYDDSDAISLLSNIADRSRRRSRSTRRREEWGKRAATLGCGLFGRPKGQIQRREVTRGDGNRSHHRRDDSRDSLTSVGAESDEDGGVAQSLTGSFGAGQESGDEDAGMLEDTDIAEISQPRDEQVAEEDLTVPTVHVSEHTPEHEEDLLKQKEDEERAAIKATISREAEETAKAQAEDAVRLAAEEAALAAEEEAAIAKAKRRAERREIKERLARVRTESQRERRLTEAEAEAAAGGFDFAEEGEQVEPQAYDYREEEVGYGEEGYGAQYDGAFRHSPQYEQQLELNQQEVVHHHHYYHEPQPVEDTYDDRLLSPNFRIAELPAMADQEKREEAVDEDEDDADIAGITFSKNKKGRSRGEGGSNTYSRSNGSGSGSKQSGSASGQRQVRYESHRKGSDQSAEGLNGGSSASGKKSYRDRPRRHERTGSRSTGSGTGVRSREGVPSRTMMASPTIPEGDRDLRADAAAGGFDDFVVPPSEYAVEPESEQVSAGYRARERHGSRDQGSTSSSGQRRERRREGPTGGGLNMPRNPGGANVFLQGRGGNTF